MWAERGRIVQGALVASLLLNLFLAGVLVGRFGSAARQARPAGFTSAERVRALPAGERLVFGLAMAPHRPAIRAARKALGQAREEAIAAITAQPYDAGRVGRALAALRQATTAQQTAVQTGLVEALAKLDPGSRALLAGGAERRVAAPGP